MVDAPPAPGVREAVLGSGAGGPLTPPTPWIQEKDLVSNYIQYAGGVVIGAPTGGNKGNATLNLPTLYLNGVIVNLGLYFPYSGGTFSGMVTLFADPANPFDAATKRYVDNAVSVLNSTIVKYLPLAGGTLTGNLSMGAGTFINLSADPAGPLQAATKQYVDTKFSGIIGIADAPADGNVYGRSNNAWVNAQVIDIGTY
jgi:hypothetical protein